MKWFYSIFLFPSSEKTIKLRPKTAEKIEKLTTRALAGSTPANFQALCGVLAFASGVDLAGRTYIYGLNRALADLQSLYGHKFPTTGSVEISATARIELEYWQKIKNHQPRNFSEVKRSILPFKIFTDASLSNFGVKIGNKQIRGEFPLELTATGIQTKETFALFYYLKNFAPPLTEITILVDNQSLVSNFKKRMSRNEDINGLLRQMFDILKVKKSVVNIYWISTHRMLAEGADGLTRSRFVDYFSDDKSLSEMGKERLLELSGLDLKKTTDVFASSVDNPLNVYYAHINWDTSDTKALGLDGFQFLGEQEGKKLAFHLYIYFRGVVSS